MPDVLDTGPQPALSATSDAIVVQAATPEEVATAEAVKTEPAVKTDVGTEPATEQESQSDKKALPKGVQKRFGELSGERDEALAKAEAANARAEQVERDLQAARQQLESLSKPVTQEELTPPNKGDFDDPDAYIEALIDFKAEQKMRESEVKRTQADQHQAIVRHEAVLNERWSGKVEEVKVKHPDYDEVTARDDIHVSMPMVHAMRMVDNGPEIAYHLGKNPDVAARLAQLPPDAAILEIGKISTQLNAPEKKPVSKTPAPIAPIGGRDAATSNPETETMDEYIQRRARENGGKPIR